MGVCIETRIDICLDFNVLSHPIWVCVLKLILQEAVLWKRKVTPYMGVWIETRPQIKQMLTNLVTPYMGVCIETLGPTYFKGKTESHTLYGCVD